MDDNFSANALRKCALSNLHNAALSTHSSSNLSAQHFFQRTHAQGLGATLTLSLSAYGGGGGGGGSSSNCGSNALSEE